MQSERLLVDREKKNHEMEYEAEPKRDALNIKKRDKNWGFRILADGKAQSAVTSVRARVYGEVPYCVDVASETSSTRKGDDYYIYRYMAVNIYLYTQKHMILCTNHGWHLVQILIFRRTSK